MNTDRPTLYGIGLGPGDPELLTLKAVRLLRTVDSIFCPGSVAARIVEALELPAEKFRRVSLCMQRERSSDLQTYDGVARQIVELLQLGQSTAWISEGDPLLYSTFVHVRRAVLQVAPRVAVEVVPGVTSLQAAAARAGVPIAELDEQVAIVPAAYGIERLPHLLESFATIFLVKVHAVVEPLVQQLQRLRVPVEAYYLEQVGTPMERIVTDLGSLCGQKLPYFSLVILRRAAKEGR
jgi:precorrin-2/cobalt-factor-2 C20-methyltransferase